MILELLILFHGTYAGYCTGADPNCHVYGCWDSAPSVCVSCDAGYMNFADGKCRKFEDVEKNTQFSLPTENIIFMKNSELLDAYEKTFIKESYVDKKSKLHLGVAQLVARKYGDNFDLVYVTSYEAAYDCASYTKSVCDEAPLCRWSSNSCKRSGGAFPDQYFGEWPPEFKTLNGAVKWGYSSSDKIDNIFSTHFHEMAHEYLVHFFDWGKNGLGGAHWGATGLDKWGIMGGWDQKKITCASPAGKAVTSPNSCNKQNGKIYLNFGADVGYSQHVSSPGFGSKFSDWELYIMGLLSESQMAGKSLFHCNGDRQQSSVGYPQGCDGWNNKCDGFKIACDSITFYDAKKVKDAIQGGIKAKNSFRAAHVVLVPDEKPLPTTFDSIPAHWKIVSNFLKSELPNEFKKATKNLGTVDYKVKSIASPTQNVATSTLRATSSILKSTLLKSTASAASTAKATSAVKASTTHIPTKFPTSIQSIPSTTVRESTPSTTVRESIPSNPPTIRDSTTRAPSTIKSVTPSLEKFSTLLPTKQGIPNKGKKNKTNDGTVFSGKLTTLNPLTIENSAASMTMFVITLVTLFVL